MIRNNNTFYTLIESDNENVWDMSVEEKELNRTKMPCKRKYQLTLFLDTVHAEFGLSQGYDRIPEYFPSKTQNKITRFNIFFQYEWYIVASSRSQADYRIIYRCSRRWRAYSGTSVRCFSAQP